MNRKRVREVAAAAKAAGTLGSAARTLVPDLLPLLDARACRVPAVQALLSIAPQDCGGVAPETIADLLVTAAGDERLPAYEHDQALALLWDLHHHHPGAVGPQARARLRDLVESPARTRFGGPRAIAHTIRDDERFRTAIRGLLEELP